MAIDQDNYEYTVVEHDSLTKIARKHGMKPEIKWARKIWVDPHNSSLHRDADMNGKEVRRQLHIGNSRYEKYDHANWGDGYRGYDDPHQIILYVGEKIWIPAREEAGDSETGSEDDGVIRKDLTSIDLKGGLEIAPIKEYELTFPVLRLQFALDPETIHDNEKYTLTSTDPDSYYKQTLTIKDDKVEIEGRVYLIFKGVRKDLRYTLEYDPGRAEDEEGNKLKKFNLIEDEPLSDFYL